MDLIFGPEHPFEHHDQISCVPLSFILTGGPEARVTRDRASEENANLQGLTQFRRKNIFNGETHAVRGAVGYAHAGPVAGVAQGRGSEGGG